MKIKYKILAFIIVLTTVLNVNISLNNKYFIMLEVPKVEADNPWEYVQSYSTDTNAARRLAARGKDNKLEYGDYYTGSDTFYRIGSIAVDMDAYNYKIVWDHNYGNYVRTDYIYTWTDLENYFYFDDGASSNLVITIYKQISNKTPLVTLTSPSSNSPLQTLYDSGKEAV